MAYMELSILLSARIPSAPGLTSASHPEAGRGQLSHVCGEIRNWRAFGLLAKPYGTSAMPLGLVEARRPG
jgi:hypothetical protein